MHYLENDIYINFNHQTIQKYFYFYYASTAVMCDSLGHTREDVTTEIRHGSDATNSSRAHLLTTWANVDH